MLLILKKEDPFLLITLVYCQRAWAEFPASPVCWLRLLLAIVPAPRLLSLKTLVFPRP